MRVNSQMLSSKLFYAFSKHFLVVISHVISFYINMHCIFILFIFGPTFTIFLCLLLLYSCLTHFTHFPLFSRWQARVCKISPCDLCSRQWYERFPSFIFLLLSHLRFYTYSKGLGFNGNSVRVLEGFSRKSTLFLYGRKNIGVVKIINSYKNKLLWFEEAS